MKRKIKVKKEFLRASFKPKSYNEDRNTIDVTFSTGAKVKRFSFSDGEFYEELSLRPSHVQLGRFKSGAPVLDNHGTAESLFGPSGVRGLDDIIGKVEDARLEKDGQGNRIGVATVRLTNRPEKAGVVQDIREGMISKVSIGYRVNKFEELKQRSEDDLPILRAVDWEPMELSFVAIPADDGAQARNFDQVLLDCEVELNNQQGGAMSLKDKKRKEAEEKRARALDLRSEGEEEQAVALEAEADAADAEADKLEAEETTEAGQGEGEEAGEESGDAEGEEAEGEGEEAGEESGEESGDAEGERSSKVDELEIRKKEIARQDEIRKACKVAKLDGKFADSLCKDATIGLEQARSLIFKEMEKRTNTVTMNQRVEVNDMGQKELRRKACVRALLHRSNPSKYELKQDGDQEFRTDSLIQTARNFLAQEGVSNTHTMTKAEVATRGLHHSSDFPLVLADLSNKSLQDSYASAPATFQPFVNERSVPDFKTINSMRLSDGGKLRPTNEHGEYERTTLEESKESYKVEKFGLVIGRTWELMMNDDLGAFTDIAAKLGKRAREKESEIFWGLITTPQVMEETGQPLFDATHNNIGTGGPISIASMGEGRAKMRTHLDLDGELIGGLNGRFLVTPAALETVGNQFLGQIQPDQSGNVNPFAGNLRQIVEPRLDAASATRWYMFADTSMIDMAEMARLDGRGPEISVREGFEVDGMETKIRYVFGMRILDYRGFFTNAGA